MTAIAANPPQHTTVRAADTSILEIITVPIDATRSTVQVHGELDLAGADALAAALDDELTQGHRFTRLDLSRLVFIDCAGLGAILGAHNRFLAARGTLILTGVGPRLTRLLDITQLQDALFIADRPTRPEGPTPRRRSSFTPPAMSQ